MSRLWDVVSDVFEWVFMACVFLFGLFFVLSIFGDALGRILGWIWMYCECSVPS